MGWLWASSVDSTPVASDTSSSLPVESTREAPMPSKPLTRDEIADKELRLFLEELEADTHSSSRKYNRVPQPPPGTARPTRDDDSPEPLSEQLLPRAMSCRMAFDSAFYCQSFGGKFNDVYRYGTILSCSDHWSDFWFCMRTRNQSGPQKEEAIRDHYRAKEARKYQRGDSEMGNSSEDIWQSREKKLKWGVAFCVPEPAKFEGNDEQWNESERARRVELNKAK